MGLRDYITGTTNPTRKEGEKKPPAPPTTDYQKGGFGGGMTDAEILERERKRAEALRRFGETK